MFRLMLAMFTLVAGSVACAQSKQDALNLDDGRTFYRLCTGELIGDDKEMSRMLCMSYLEGAMQAFHTLEEVQGAHRFFCFPKGMSRDGVRKAYLRWVDANPDKRDRPRNIAVFIALSTTYTCK